MIAEWVIVDGFSLLHRLPELAAQQRGGRFYPARHGLVSLLEKAIGRAAARITVVFDGRGEGGPSEEFAASPVEVVYSPAGRTADAVIERMVHEAPDPSALAVVTSDRVERDTVTAAGGRTVSCLNFIEQCGWLNPPRRPAPRRPGAVSAPPSLGELFPDWPPPPPGSLCPRQRRNGEKSSSGCG